MHRYSRRPVTTTTSRPHRGLGSLFSTRRRAVPQTTTVATRPHRRRGFFQGTTRRRHHTTAAPVTVTHHHKRHTTIGDKISGALLKLKGTITGRPGQKAAGTRRMHGTDGRGARRRRFL